MPRIRKPLAQPRWVRLEPQTDEDLIAAAHSEEREISEVIRIAVNFYLDEKRLRPRASSRRRLRLQPRAAVWVQACRAVESTPRRSLAAPPG